MYSRLYREVLNRHYWVEGAECFVSVHDAEGLLGIMGAAPAAYAGHLTEVLAARLARDGGAALLIDYGHDSPGLGETLQAVKGHEYANPLTAPGECDLTAHVDFAMVAACGAAAGARVWGPVGQGELLERLGIGARAMQLLAGADAAQAEGIASARHRLTADDVMGRLFRAVVLTHPGQPAPPGFETLSWA